MVRTVMQDIATVNDKRHIALYNTNELLLDRTVTGVKTGYTSKAGRCLIASSTFENGHRVLLVALNVADQWEQAARMLRYGQAVLHVAN
jgi:D-alanyl-D-alanine carboxypeptidase (penicillin-binding protein 5/6)